jgi:hypothetical protein
LFALAVDELQACEVLAYNYLLSTGDYRNIHQIDTDHGVVHSPVHMIQVDRLHKNYTSTENNKFDFLNKKVEMFSILFFLIAWKWIWLSKKEEEMFNNKNVDIKFSAHETFLK